MNAPRRKASRRGALAVLAGAGALMAWRPWARDAAPADGFEPVPELPGFRRAVGAGQVSALPFDPATVGLGAPSTDPPDPTVAAAVRENPCGALYRGAAVPAIAYFTDIRCPSCRALEETLDRLEAETPGVTRVTHEWPILSPGSEVAARALLAAGPDLAPRLRARLRRSPAALDTGQIARIAGGLGADADRLLREMDGPGVSIALEETRALARAFGFAGTPGLVIGGTAVSGAWPRARLAALLEEEAGRPAPC